MKLEARGKYAGIKIHLDKTEVESLLEIDTHPPGKEDGIHLSYSAENFLVDFGWRLVKKLKKYQQEDPTFNEDRTPEQIKAALEKEAAKAAERLKQLEETGKVGIECKAKLGVSGGGWYLCPGTGPKGGNCTVCGKEIISD